MLNERKANRMKGYDYSRNNHYFITSCVQNRICCFGKIIYCESSGYIMELNEYGQIALNQWQWLEKQYPYVKLHAFIVMPNHIHGIIEIDRDLLDVPVAGSYVVGTGCDLSLQHMMRQQGNFDDNQTALPIIKIKSLSELIGAYKTTVSKQIHLLGYNEFKWQRSFHDHFIRDEQAFENISEYINNNPSNWETDDLRSDK